MLKSTEHINNFSQMLYFLPKTMIIQEEGGIAYVDKTDAKRRGVWHMLTWLTKGGGGVGEMLTLADKGGRGGGLKPPIFC